MRRDLIEAISNRIFAAIMEKNKKEREECGARYNKLLDAAREKDKTKMEALTKKMRMHEEKWKNLKREIEQNDRETRERAAKIAGYEDHYEAQHKAYKLREEAEFELMLMDAKGFDFEAFLKKYLAK